MKINNTNDYLNNLEQHLGDLPTSEKESIIEEIRDHFINEIEKRKNNGESKEQAEINTINTFKEPKQLAKDFLSGSKNRKSDTALEYSKEDLNTLSLSFFLINLWLGGSALLAIPISDGYIQLHHVGVGMIAVLITYIHILTKKTWKNIEIKSVRSIQRAIAFLLFPGSLLLFWINGNITSFLITYSVIYWIFLLVNWFIFKFIFHKTN